MTETEKLQQALDSAVGMPKVRWRCSACVVENVRVDNGKGRQQAACWCGQNITLLNTSRADWFD